MDPLWLILPVVLVSCAEALTRVKVAPGQDANLNCSMISGDVYWYIEIRSQVKGAIARTFSPYPDDAIYCVPPNRTKYIAMGNQMRITNVSAEDYRLYFCARKAQNDNITVVETFRLLSVTNDSEADQQQLQHICTLCRSQLVVYGSFALNALLLSVIIGLVFTTLSLKRKNYNVQVIDPSPLTYEDPQTLEMPQYEEIQLGARPQAAPPPECIYYKAQRPRSTVPQHH